MLLGANNTTEDVIESKKIGLVSADYLLTEDNIKFENDSKLYTDSMSGDLSAHADSDENRSTVPEANDGICINLSIESIDGSMRAGFNCDENSEQQIYTQISAQITKMLQAVLIFNENETERFLHVANFTGDGNCLFRALAHQLFCEKLNSAIQKNSTKKLRTDVVRYINLNYEKFIHELKGCVFDLKNKNEISDYESECHSYIDDILSKDGSWGVSETIKAVSSMHSVNILLFNEYGTCYYVNGFNSEYRRTVAMAYRLEIGFLN